MTLSNKKPTLRGSISLLEQYTNDSWASHWGIQGGTLDNEQALLELPFKEIQLNHPSGVVHGGVLATAMHDAGLLLACKAYGIKPLQIELLDQQISYIGGTRDQRITISAIFSRKARRFAFLHAEIKDEQNRMIANSQLCFRIKDDTNYELPETCLYQAPSPLKLSPDHNYPMADERFGINLKERSGIEITHLSENLTQLRMPLEERYRDFRGQISNGVILHLTDTAGVLGPLVAVPEATSGATVDFKMSFCEPTFDEPLLATSSCINQSSGIMFSKIEVHGEQSGRLKAFGTQTFLVDCY